jgi:hypothetical protein
MGLSTYRHQYRHPDFAVAIYPGHLWAGGNGYGLNPNVLVTHQTPPTFLVQAEDDNVDGVHQSIAYYIALKGRKGSRRDAFVRERRARIWAAPHEASHQQLAAAGGQMARYDRHDGEMSAPSRAVDWAVTPE